MIFWAKIPKLECSWRKAPKKASSSRILIKLKWTALPTCKNTWTLVLRTEPRELPTWMPNLPDHTVFSAFISTPKNKTIRETKSIKLLNLTWSIWPVHNVRAKQERQEMVWSRQQRSTYHWVHWVMSFQLWSMVRHITFLTEIQNWPDFFKIHWEVTLRQ